jgi:RNA polymerase sigma-70 factor (ECF subfamily)
MDTYADPSLLVQFRGMPVAFRLQRRDISSPALQSDSSHSASVSNYEPQQKTDAALIAAMARRDQAAAAQLYDRYSAMLFALALRITMRNSDAEEVVLDSFMQAWNSASTYDSARASVAGWLTTIARTRALDAVRARVRRDRVSERAATESNDDAPIAMSSSESSPIDLVEDQERGQVVGKALLQLPEKQRRVIELAFYEGLTHSEIAASLMEPLGTVKTRIRLAMLRLREVLGNSAREMRS